MGAMEPANVVSDAWLDFVGSLHPALVHFPIALALVAAAVELWRAFARRGGIAPFSFTAIWIAAGGAVLAAVSGWVSPEARGGSPSGDIFLHRWLGVIGASALLALAFTVVRARDSQGSRAQGKWRTALVATAMCLGAEGSLGGDLVHGEGHITDALWRAIDATERGQRADAEAAARVQLGAPPSVVTAPSSVLSPGADSHAWKVDYEAQVVPLLTAHCYECHGHGKKKGGVRLDDLDRLTREQAGKWVVKPGDPNASLLIKVVTLGADDEDRMPPEGDRLNDDQVALLKDWISEGAHGASVPASATHTPDPGWVALARAMTPDERAQVDATASLLASRGILLRPLSADTASLELDLSRATPVAGDAELIRVAGVAGLVASITAARSGLTDGSAAAFAPLIELRSIRLDFTAAGDATAGALARLPHLHTANFAGTPLTDAGLAALASSSSLRRVFVWSSSVTPEGIAAARHANPNLSVIVGD